MTSPMQVYSKSCPKCKVTVETAKERCPNCNRRYSAMGAGEQAARLFVGFLLFSLLVSVLLYMNA